MIEIQGFNRDNTREEPPESRVNKSIFNNRKPKKRRGILGKNSRKENLILKNVGNLVTSLRHIVFFMKQLLKCENYTEVIEFAQLLSKAHFFKWQNKNTEFKVLKK